MSYLQVDSVAKSFDNKVILSDVFLSCEVGTVNGLIGRNGCGKSTLLKIIFGTEKAEYKFVRIGNKVIKNISDGRHLINYLPQDNFLPNNIRIKNLIKLFLPKACREVVLKNEYVVPLLQKKNQELSGGEKRIVEILLIIHSNAQFILLDEPFNGVSPILRDYIINYINDMRSSKGFIITDHDYENVINLADNLFYLQNGYLKEVKNQSELVALGYISPAIFNEVFKQ
ncbi:ATP-binding cassette domain-containing protein [Gaetbulibacter aestuarii]|uniref:ATP-binding cassette domain-containing protein n=1 Tax=Gaetbulibacter aestuarii TaxID=1502358 RepID=A0ABW7MX97_9FLAO